MLIYQKYLMKLKYQTVNNLKIADKLLAFVNEELLKNPSFLKIVSIAFAKECNGLSQSTVVQHRI